MQITGINCNMGSYYIKKFDGKTPAEYAGIISWEPKTREVERIRTLIND